MLRQNLGNSLKAAGLSHNKFAREANVSQPVISYFLRGNNPQNKTISKIENAMIQKGWLHKDALVVTEPAFMKKRVTRTRKEPNVRKELIAFIVESDATNAQKILFLDYLL